MPSSPKEIDTEGDWLKLVPNYDIVKPHKGAFVYHKPSDDIDPMHTPNKVLYPGNWKFYDINLDTVKEEVAKEITFARNLTKEQFEDKEEFYNLLVAHNQRQERRPVIG